jgi:ADP-ribose pyrophosphatase YjhB (NUDIX family)
MVQNRVESLEEFKNILDKMPIACLDVVAMHDGKFLMVKRKDEPARGQWWMIGGRVFKGETFKETALRKLKEEANLTGEVKELHGPYETMFDEAPHGVTSGHHTVNTVALVEVEDISGMKTNEFHEDIKWFDTIDENWHWYVKQALRDCGVK